MGCLVALFLIIVAIGFNLLIDFVLTKVILWLSLGLFNYDLSNKFWYIFVIVFLVISIISPLKVNIKTKG